MQTMPLVRWVVFVFAAACSGSIATPAGVAPPAADAAVPPVASCTESPLADACLTDETASLFVAPSGSDVLGTGTRARPLKTIAVALTKLTPDRRRVYLCEGRYAEDLHVGAEHAALVLAGGLDCSWMPNGSRAVIGAETPDLSTPIIVDPVEQTITLHSIEARAHDAPNASAASIVARVRGATTFRNVRLVAGRGADGDRGADGKPLFYSGQLVDPDHNPSGAIGGRSSCEDGISQGGDGPGGSGAPGPTNGGASVACAAGGNGGNGQSGVDGATAGIGAADIGAAFGATGSELAFFPRAGGDGKDGALGQGGGAGGGAAGAGGGAGGCGGGHGRGGSGGSGSIAIQTWDAKVVVIDSLLQTAGGGAGGAGGAGAAGQVGQAAGTNSGCAAGKGGSGGRGTGGGGGAGGLSVGVLYTGTAPDLDTATLNAVALGKAGAGGAGGEATNAGISGVRAPLLEVARTP